MRAKSRLRTRVRARARIRARRGVRERDQKAIRRGPRAKMRRDQTRAE